MFFKKKRQILKCNKLPFFFSFFSDFLLYYSFYVTFFTKRGFLGTQLAYLLLAMNTAKMIADIPVGIISDIYSRRNILIFGLLCKFVFCILCVFESINLNSSSFLLCIIAMVIVGIGNSCLLSHTWSYFYDYFRQQKKESIFPQFMGKFYATSNIAISCAGFIGSYIVLKINFIGIFLCSALSIIIAIFFISKMPNYKPKTTIKTAKNIKISSPLKFLSLINKLLKKPLIIRLLLLAMLMDSIFIIFLDLNTMTMNYIMEIDTISQIVGFVAFVRIFSNYFSGYMEKNMSFKRVHSLLLILMVFSFIASCLNSTWMVISISTYLCIYPFFDTSIKTKIERRLDANIRATVMSLVSLFASILTIILNSITAIVIKQYNYFSAPICVFMIVIIILFFVRNISRCYRLDLNIRKILSNLFK